MHLSVICYDWSVAYKPKSKWLKKAPFQKTKERLQIPKYVIQGQQADQRLASSNCSTLSALILHLLSVKKRKHFSFNNVEYSGEKTGPPTGDQFKNFGHQTLISSHIQATH